jgi:septal ring factor EnvC (AmiA/AmiB activator)
MRRARRNSALILIALAAALSGPRSEPVVAAQPIRQPKEDTTRQQIEQAERDHAAQQAAQQAAAAKAAAAAAEADRLTAERVAAAARLRDAEVATEQAATRMDQLSAQRRQAKADLDARAEAMQPLLPVIERLSLYPAETLLAVPAPPEETLRGVLVLRGLAHQLGAEAVALRVEQARLDMATQAMAAETPKLAAAEAAQQAQAVLLDRQIAVAEAGGDAAQNEAAAAEQRGADAAARADTLRGMLTELETQRRADEARARADAARADHDKLSAEAAAARERQAALAHPTGPGAIASAAQPHGQLTAPVAGSVIRSWGDATDGGPATGISYRAPPAARVVSPCGGRVVFAAPFRSYGQLLIVDCGGGYHAVLAGFDRLDAKVGQQVAAGEPVGVAPSWEPGTPGNRPALYMELRREGQPINPAPWLRASS